MVGRRHGVVGAATPDPDRAASGTAGNLDRLPHRVGVGADHHDHQRDDRAAIRRRKHPVQRARHGPVRYRVRHDHHCRRDGYWARRLVRTNARPAGEMVGAAVRYSPELFMKTRALTSDVLFGLVPIALLVAVWQALVSFGYAPVTLLPPPGLVFA